MSKKIIYIRIIVITICLIFLGSIIFVIVGIQKSITESNILEETTSNVEEKIVFDLMKSPQEQKRKIIEHKKEYLDQIYDYIFEDRKFANCLGYNILSEYDIVDDFKSTYSLKYYLENSVYDQLFYKLFDDRGKFDMISLLDLPLTKNYIESHSNSLKEEYSQYFKEDYTKLGKGKMYDMDYTNLFTYHYGISHNDSKKEIYVCETKTISYVCEDGTSGSLWGKKGSKYEGQELYAELRTIYFKYKLDEKGYLDDIWFDHVEIIADEKDLDDSVNFWEE